MSLSTLHAQLVKRVDQRLGIHGISFTEFMVMYHLNAAPNHTMRRIDLAQSIGMSASGVTRLLVPMEKIKLVQKERQARDARVSLIKLSNARRRLFTDALVSLEYSADLVLQALNDRELVRFLQLTEKLL